MFWRIKTTPVIFGRNVELMCNVTSKPHTCKRCLQRWHIGTHGDLIAVGDRTMDSSKYTAVVGKDSYILMIHNFSKDDVNIKYGCIHGFESYTSHLEMDDSFEHHPTNDTLKTKHQIDEDSTLILNIEFEEVHPTPKCSVFFDDKNLTSQLQVNVQTSGIFEKVSVSLRHKFGDICLNEKLHVICTIGTKQFDTIKTDISYNCDNGMSLGIWLTIIFTTCVGLLILYRVLKCLAKREKDNDGINKNKRKDKNSTNKSTDPSSKRLFEIPDNQDNSDHR